MDLKDKIREIPDWPKPGVNFKDITTVLADPAVFAEAIDAMADRLADAEFDKIVGIDARGFLFASPVAYKLKKGLVIVRKKGKLPPATIEKEYTLEYGSNTIEMKSDAVRPGERFAIIDDLCATGGTVQAACDLIERSGGRVGPIFFVIDLPFLDGSKKLKDRGYDVRSLVSYDSE